MDSRKTPLLITINNSITKRFLMDKDEKEKIDRKEDRKNSIQLRDLYGTSVTPIADTLHCGRFVELHVDTGAIYTNVITTKGKVAGNTSITRNPTCYRIMRRDVDNRTALRRNIHANPMTQRFEYNSSICAELEGLNRKYSNFSGCFKYGDMSKILFRLGQMLGCYRCTGHLSWDDVMAGSAINVRALGVMDEPVAASNSHVFIPRHASIIDHPATFAAFVCAANSTGSMVITDVLRVTTEQNAPIVQTYSDATLASGVVNGIRILLAMMDSCNAGAIASLALARGLHDICTVIGHTDEGSYFRDVLRRQDYVISYGGIYTDLAESFVGLPIPNRGTKASYSALVDSILLKSAALVAVSDPCEEIGSITYPTVYASNVSPTGDGRNNAGTNEDAIDIANTIGANCGRFAKNYVSHLAAIFLMHGAEDTARDFMVMAFQNVTTNANRHLKYNTVAPYYWIEPTGLFSTKVNSVANKNGYGVLVGFGEPEIEMDMFENMQIHVTSNNQTWTNVTWRSARTSGFVLHHALNARNGLANVRIHQAAYSLFALRGGADEAIGTSIERRAALNEYLWGRGDAGIPAPAELLYTGDRMMLYLRHLVYDENGDVADNGMRSMQELDLKYYVTVGKPSLLMEGTISQRTVAVWRSRTGAVDALNRVHAWIRNGWHTGGEEVVLGNMIPPRIENVATPEPFGQSGKGSVTQEPFGEGNVKRGASSSLIIHDQPMRNRLHGNQTGMQNQPNPMPDTGGGDVEGDGANPAPETQ